MPRTAFALFALLALLAAGSGLAQQPPGQWKDAMTAGKPATPPAGGPGRYSTTAQLPGRHQAPDIDKDAEIARLQALVAAQQEKISLLESKAALLEAELRKRGAP